MAHTGYAVAYTGYAREVMSVWHELNQRYENFHMPQVTIYSDGACFGNGQYDAKAGWGLYFPYPLQHLSTGGKVAGMQQTNQKAELTAIYEAIRRAPADHHVIIYTDSQHAIDCFTHWVTDWEATNYVTQKGHEVINRDIIQATMRVRRQRRTKVDLKYVAAHLGDPGNTKADENAKAGARGHYA